MRKILSILFLLTAFAFLNTSCDDENTEVTVTGDSIIFTNKTTGETLEFNEDNSKSYLDGFFSFFGRSSVNSSNFADIQIVDPNADGDITNKTESDVNDMISITADGKDYSLGGNTASYDFSGTEDNTVGTISYTTDDDQEVEIEIK